MLKARKEKGKLTRRDIIVNPFYTFYDLPCVLLTVLTALIFPWRFIWTFLPLVGKHSHFPSIEDDYLPIIKYDMVLLTLQQGFFDLIYLPVYILAVLHPFNVQPFYSLLWKHCLPT